jgi:hypothetical protein
MSAFAEGMPTILAHQIVNRLAEQALDADVVVKRELMQRSAEV